MWHTFQPFFSEKFKSRESIVLNEKSKTISEDEEVAFNLNVFFTIIAKNHNTPEHHLYAIQDRLSNHPILKTILKYKNYPSIRITIRCATRHLSSFYFFPSLQKHCYKKTKKLEILAVQDLDIPIKILRENADLFAEHIWFKLNAVIFSSIFLASFIVENITLVFKVGSRNQKNNYKPIRILPIIAKIYKKLILQQLSC